MVLNQDVARAALAISLHDIQPDKNGYPNFFPISIFDYPLTALLIIVDGLQEYLRWEGTSIVGGTKLLSFPDLSIVKEKSIIKLSVNFAVSNDGDAVKYLIEQANAILKYKNENREVNNRADATQILCDNLVHDLQNRIKKDNKFQINISFCDEKGDEFLSKKVHA